MLLAWREFLVGKRNKKDVQVFQYRLSDNILDLHTELKEKKYTHGSYHAFNISDPKPRNIHKAAVRDRLLHHAIHRTLYPFLDRMFIADSYSCRVGKGTHKAINRFRAFSYAVSKNHTKTAWVLKCDIRKFFASIDQRILLEILARQISDKDVLWLLERIIVSFHSGISGKGLPLGNLTSQLLVNIYMNEFDQFVKHKLKVKLYIRYADDFVIMSRDREWLEMLLPRINKFLRDKLKLNLHPDKVFIKTLTSGVDFLGWVHFPDHRVLRTATKRRVLREVRDTDSKPDVVQSYLGLLGHGNTKKLQRNIANAESFLLFCEPVLQYAHGNNCR